MLRVRSRKKKRSGGLLLLAALIICLMMILTGCRLNTIDSFCLVYTPVHNTGDIKPDAQRIAVKRNNLKYEELCE